MDERKLDRLEQALYLHARKQQAAAVPVDFTARVMRSVRAKAERGADFWDIFGLVARRFAPVGAFAATAVCGYVQLVDKALSQALLSLSLHGGAPVLFARMLP